MNIEPKQQFWTIREYAELADLWKLYGGKRHNQNAKHPFIGMARLKFYNRSDMSIYMALVRLKAKGAL